MDAITTQWVNSVAQALPTECREVRVGSEADSVTFVFADAECSLRPVRTHATGELGVRGVFTIREAEPGLGSWWTCAHRSLPSRDWHHSGPTIAEWLATTLGEARRLLVENGHLTLAAETRNHPPHEAPVA